MPNKKGLNMSKPPVAAPNLLQSTFLGKLGFKRKLALLFILFASAAIAFGTLFFQIDKKVNNALIAWSSSRALSAKSAAIKETWALIKRGEMDFLSNESTVHANLMFSRISKLSGELDDLRKQPLAGNLEKEIDTLRDGVLQYAQHLKYIVSSEQEKPKVKASLNRLREKLALNLKSKLSALELGNLLKQLAVIEAEIKTFPKSGSEHPSKKLEYVYREIYNKLRKANIKEADHFAAQNLIKSHESHVLLQIKTTTGLNNKKIRLNEITEYILPSLENIAGNINRLEILAATNIRDLQTKVRYTISWGSALILICLVLCNYILIRALMRPAQTLAGISKRLAAGNRVVSIPVRGNADEFGIIANAFVEWSNSLEITEELREELEETRTKLENALIGITGSHQPSFPRTPDTVSSKRDPSSHFSEIPPFPETPQQTLEHAETSSLTESENTQPGALSTASQQLQNFTQFVSAAANSVEQTESLIGGLNKTNQLVAKIAELILNIRSQINHFTFENLLEHQTTESNLVHLSEPKTKFTKFLLEKTLVKRLEALQETANRTDLTLTELRAHLDKVKMTAQGIAASASSQAVEATGKLLNQSENLQSMLDNLLIKMEQISSSQDNNKKLSRRGSADSLIDSSSDKS
ncbi:MAG: hypothetical protein CMF70_05910 [Magnetovibrio sp.]|nr:hypothetical protein [Magnetovibrio sp.]